jgi:hypothetical protein
VVYLYMSDECVAGIEKLDHAFFFSVQTAATIGARHSTSCILNLYVCGEEGAPDALDKSILHRNCHTGRKDPVCMAEFR